MRHKEINVLNLPKPLKYVYDFAKSNMSEKLKDRFKVSHRRIFYKYTSESIYLIMRDGLSRKF